VLDFQQSRKTRQAFLSFYNFFSEFSQIGQKNYSLANLALHQLNCELVGVFFFFVSAIIRLGRHVKSQIRKSSLVRVFRLGKKVCPGSCISIVKSLVYVVTLSEPNGSSLICK